MKKEIGVALAWSGGMIATALAASWAKSQGYIGQDEVVRVVAMNGLMIAYYGNLAPKTVAPSAFARQINRFSGWAMVLSGLVYAALWGFAPLPIAQTVGTGSVAVGIAATVGYCLWLRGKAAA